MDLKAILQSDDNKWSPEAKLLFPENEAFPMVTERWSIAHPPTFAASITAGSIEDVQSAVKLAASHGIQFMATSGKHGYCSRLAELHGGLQIDLSALNRVAIDAASNSMTVGPGAQFKNILEPLFNAGKEMTFGFCSTVSCIGATLGGGIGRYQALHGLLIDQLVSARVVTASGDLITASKTENADLFWALRGAGVFFGIVVEATYRVHDLTNNGECQDSTMVFPLAAAEPVLQALTDVDERGELPNDLMISAAFAWEPRMSAAVFLLNFTSPIPSAPFQAHIQPFLALSPLATETKTLPFPRLHVDGAMSIEAILGRKRQLTSAYNMCTKRIDAQALAHVAGSLAALYETEPEARGSSLSIEWYGKDVVEVVDEDGEEGGVFAWRDSKAYFVIQASWTAPETSASLTNTAADTSTTPSSSSAARTAANNWARASRATLGRASGFETDGSTTAAAANNNNSHHHKVFVSYAYGDETPTQIFRTEEKVRRLREIKGKWDPGNVFRWGPAIF